MPSDMTRVSWELSEVRTVLSRAETALKDLRRRAQVSSQLWDHDPDAAEIQEDLEAVVELLEKWARTNKNGTRKVPTARR